MVGGALGVAALAALLDGGTGIAPFTHVYLFCTLATVAVAAAAAVARHGAFAMKIEITMEEILEDLCWPGPPPGLAVGAARSARARPVPGAAHR